MTVSCRAAASMTARASRPSAALDVVDDDRRQPGHRVRGQRRDGPGRARVGDEVVPVGVLAEPRDEQAARAGPRASR